MMYRFIGTERTYGPRALDWVVRTYGGREDASAAPEHEANMASAWRTVADWALELPSAAASAEQLARLAKLGVETGPPSTFAAAAEAIEEAEGQARAKRGQRKPTTLKLKRLADLGLSAPANATRAEVDQLLRAHELQEIAKRLAARGLRLPNEGLTEDNRYDLADAVDSLDFGLQQAAERGFRYQPEFPLSADQMKKLAELLDEFWSASGDLDWEWQHLVEEGTLALRPTAAERIAVLPVLFDLVRNGRWSADPSEYLALGELATTARSSKGAS